MKKSTFVTSIAALLFAAGTLAQETGSTPPLSDVWVVAPKAGMTEEFEKAVAGHMAFRADNGDSRQWLTFRPVIGDKLDIYMFRACCFDWADQDDYESEDKDKGFGEHWGENVHEYVDHYHHYFDRIDWENSHWPEDGTDGPYFGATRWFMKESGGRATGEALREMSRLAKEGGWGETEGPWLWLRQIGGKDILALVSPYQGYAEMAPPETSFYEFAVRELGSEEAADAMFEKFTSGFSSSDYTVWRYRDDLSMPGDDE